MQSHYFAHPIFNWLDPVAFSVGPMQVRWYGIAYAVAILVGYHLLLHFEKRTPPAERILTPAVQQSLILWSVLGIVIGGRVLYVLVYKMHQFLQEPLSIFKTWEGGMSFHGGMLGFITAMWLLARRERISVWLLLDRAAVVTPIGLFLGRLANFINAELWGRVTFGPMGIVFPGAGPYPRHPSQLYEAMGEGVLLGILLACLFAYTSIRRYPGRLSGVFLIGYGLVRIGVECFRAPDADLGFFFRFLTMGQLLCLPMIGFGLWLLWRKQPKIIS